VGKMETAETKNPNVAGMNYADRCMALVDMMQSVANEDPALFLLLAMYDLLEK